MVQVEFRYLTGVRSAVLRGARLRGSWDEEGYFAEPWTDTPMEAFIAQDGCPAFRQTVTFPRAEVGRVFHWGVVVDAPAGVDVWGVPSELNRAESIQRYRSFVLGSASWQRQDYYLTYARRLGARKRFDAAREPHVHFAVWAPNAREVDVVFADPDSPYIFDSGHGIAPTRAPLRLERGPDGIWEGELREPFSTLEGLPYMYRIRTEQGQVRYRTDIFSRRQAGRGGVLPNDGHWDGSLDTLDGSVSCSLVVADDSVAVSLQDGAPRISREEFWQHEFDPSLPVPTRLEELIIYELHVGGLGAGRPTAGTLRDAIDLVDHLVELGVTCLELMPINEFSGSVGWGYGQTHHFAFESSAGTLDDYRHLVRKCHRRGIAVIQDVCYNHYDFRAERAQWEYDSSAPEHNIYFWYEGTPLDHAYADGGYLDNGSSGWAPRYHEPVVRQQFISSAALLLDECHVDGFRVDLTQAFHRDNSQHSDGTRVARANLFGQKLLREWARTLRLFKPSVLLIAEDHTGWAKVTESPDTGGLGFTSTWDASFYHHLIGDADAGAGSARLLWEAGLGGDEPLRLFEFASALHATQFNRVVYHESHDEAGNAHNSARTLVTAVNGAALVGDTRNVAEARARLVFGLSVFSAGAPLFFMGEEVGFTKPYEVFGFMGQRQDVVAERHGRGVGMFRYYQDAIALRRRRPALRAANLDVIHTNPAGRVIAFVRRAGAEVMLIVASFANRPYAQGYVISSEESRLPSGAFREVHNSDAERYGGSNLGNEGATLLSSSGRIDVKLPACGVVVLRRV